MYSSSRTKKVATYGRRVQRFIPVTEEKAFSRPSPARKETDSSSSHNEDEDIYDYTVRPLPKAVKSISAKVSSKAAVEKYRKPSLGKANDKATPARRPLAVCLTNIPGSPAMATKRSTKPHPGVSKVAPAGRRLQPASPIVDVDIIVLDDGGRRLSQERRVTKTNVQVNNVGLELHPKTRKTPGRAAKRVATKQAIPAALAFDSGDEDDGDDDEYVPIAKTVKNRLKPRTTRMPLKTVRKAVVREDEMELGDSDSNLPKKPIASKRAKRPIVASESDSSFDADVAQVSKTKMFKPLRQLSPAAQRNLRKTTAKKGNGSPHDPIVIDLSPSPKQSAIAKPTRRSSVPHPELTFPSRSTVCARGSTDRSESPIGSSQDSPVPVESHVYRPFQFTPVHPMRSKSSFLQQRRPSPMQNKLSDDNEYDISISMSMDPELELALKVAELEIGDANPINILADLSPIQDRTTRCNKQSTSSISFGRKRTPNYLRPLLSECSQIMPFEFATFIETFPFDSAHGLSENYDYEDTPTFQKIGEASYSEVFGIGSVVLKVIPLTNEDVESTYDSDLNAPPTSDAKDVLKEILVTRTMGEICKGFIKLIKAHVVQGVYPPQLLKLWDVYNDLKGSESVRPDSFVESQAYAVIVLPNGGPDLETFSVSPIGTNSGVTWRQACSIFWQVARALAHAEDLVHFEHRDLHWGQILVRRTHKHPRFRTTADSASLPMDDPAHGVEATIIDLGLSRIGQGSLDTFWTPFTDEIFEGEGDYQYDIYRMMRKHNEDDWESFRPLTNVMWLHYLAGKLLSNKRLRPPATAAASVGRSRRTVLTSPARFALAEADKKAYDCLADIEKTLGLVVEPFARSVGAKSRKRSKSMKSSSSDSLDSLKSIGSAKDVVRFAKGKRWIL